MPQLPQVADTAPDEPFLTGYDMAREFGTQAIADEVLEIADNVPRRNSPDALQDARREIDALKWRLGRMAPKRREA